MWKVCSVLFSVTFLHSIMVTLLYWFLLYPVLNQATQDDPINVAKHSLPLIFLIIELLANSMVIESRHIFAVVFFGEIYIALLICYTLTGDRYIYSVMKLDSQASWNLLIFINIGVIFFYLILLGLDKIKFRLL